ncbi:MAG: hypothetical protein AB7S77_21045 [Desulfatirhabdiaceae bacterium]
MKKKLFIITFQPYDQKMYPHLYDTLSGLEKEFDINLISNDDRGYGLYDILAYLWPFDKRTVRKRISDLIQAVRIYNNRHGAIDSMRRFLIKGDYDGILVVDHHALNIASKYAPVEKRLFFWSHDIICHDSRYYKSPLIRWMIHQNRESISRCSLMIIQDEFRGALLDSIIGSHNLEKFYLPVSLKDDLYALQVSNKNSYRIPEWPLKLMQITACRNRGSHLLLKEAHNDVIIYFQGYVYDNMRDAFNETQIKPILLPLTDSFDEMRHNIAGMDIGFVSYIRKDLNERLISHSSGQMVEFFRLGIPVLAFGNDVIGKFVESTGTGIYLKNLKKLSESLYQLRDYYPDYSKAARNLFLEKFNIDGYLNQLCQKLHSSLADT